MPLGRRRLEGPCKALGHIHPLFSSYLYEQSGILNGTAAGLRRGQGNEAFAATFEKRAGAVSGLVKGAKKLGPGEKAIQRRMGINSRHLKDMKARSYMYPG